MANQHSNTILIIGGPNAGKTHFGGQLYGRLQMRASRYRITSPPENLAVFKEVLDNLNEGKSAGHTNAGAHDLLEISIEDEKGTPSVLSFPDYGGEQIRSIVADRRINNTWKEQIAKSDTWMLFLRLDEVLPVEDIVSRGLPGQDVLEKRNTEIEPMVLSAPAFYIELLQMLLYARKTGSKHMITNPKLTVALSCWDIGEDKRTVTLPVELLKQVLPALYSFISNNWTPSAWTVMGLSSTGRSLSDKEPDQEFVRKGPEHFGYLVTSDGKKHTDLTLSISPFIESTK